MTIRRPPVCPTCGNESNVEIDTELKGFPFNDEESYLESIARLYRSRPGFWVKKNLSLEHGTIDLLVHTPSGRLILIECKYSDSINDIAHALGQLLVYREQLNKEDYQGVTCVIHCYGVFEEKQLSFLGSLCNKYGVELVTPRHWFEGYYLERVIE